MKIVALADTHGVLPAVPACDLLLVGGDVTPVDHSHEPGSQYNWIIDHFDPWLRGLDAKRIVGIGGNHDFVFEKFPASAQDLPWEYLKDTSVTINGVKIHGSPWVPNLPRWAFHARPEQLEAAFSLIPEGIDILLTHGPPYGILDQCPESVGSGQLRKRVIQVNPKLHVFGHIHEGHGTFKASTGSTEYANVAIMDGMYNPIHKPTVFEW